MSKNTPIEWCDDTVNPTSGCDGCELYSPKNPGGAICYARKIHEERLAKYDANATNYAATFSEVRMIPGRLLAAAYWTDLRGKDRIGKPWLTGRPRCIFVGDLSDIFSAAVTDHYLEDEVFGVMEMPAAQRHVWMVLTKRPSRLADFSEKRAARNGYGLPRNCIAMTSVTSQATANARIPHLLRTRARWRGVSAEPLLGPVSLTAIPSLVAGFAQESAPPSCSFNALAPYAPPGVTPMKGVDWVIVGGASGSNAQPTEIAWLRGLAYECVGAKLPVFVKQLGAHVVDTGARADRIPLHHPKGGDTAEWPASLAVREVPTFALTESAEGPATTEVRHARAECGSGSGVEAPPECRAAPER